MNHEALGKVDDDRGEFWMDNIWNFPNTDHNVSAFEPNQVFLNLGGDGFANIGHLSTADSEGDGRGVLVADVTGDLQPDLIVRQSGGGPLLVFANQFAKAERLVVSLNGTKSNRLGLGAVVTAEVGGRRIVRQLSPMNNFVTTQASEVRFGLGDAQVVERLTVAWPSGTVQVLNNVRAGRHIRVTEGNPEPEVLFVAN